MLKPFDLVKLVLSNYNFSILFAFVKFLWSLLKPFTLKCFHFRFDAKRIEYPSELFDLVLAYTLGLWPTRGGGVWGKWSQSERHCGHSQATVKLTQADHWPSQPNSFTSLPSSTCTCPCVVLDEVWVCCLSILVSGKIFKDRVCILQNLITFDVHIWIHLQVIGVFGKIKIFLK